MFCHFITRYTSPHNQKVAAQVVANISSEHKENFSNEVIKCEYVPILIECMFDTNDIYTFSCAGATHQYYESRRRLFNDSKVSRTDQVLKNKVANKRKGFRKWVSVYKFHNNVSL